MSVEVVAREAERLRVLHSLDILDTDPEPAFEVFALAAQAAAMAEIGLVTFVDAERQWFKARRGLDLSETPRAIAFCAHTIMEPKVLWVEDASKDDRFARNTLVVGDPRIRAYIGAPIILDGQAIGTVCSISRETLKYNKDVAATLQILASAASQQIDMRRRLAFKGHLLQSTNDAVVATDSGGAITYWNRGAERLLGYSAAEIVGRSMLVLVPGRLRQLHLEQQQQMRDNEGVFPNPMLRAIVLHRDGSEIPIELSISTWREGGGFTMAGIARDGRERIALAEALATNRAKTRFLANMSHEIRTPLNGMLGMAQALEKASINPEQSEMVRLMLTSGRLLERLLADVLDAACAQGGGTRLASEAFNLSQLISELAHTYRLSAVEKGLAFLLFMPQDSIWVKGDAKRVEQILLKLISNAIKFTMAGEVRIVVEEAGRDFWRVRICDTGIGFNQEAAPQLFRPFHQADSSITRSYGGAGLGLSVARDLARSMGGDITAEGRPGEGAAFTFELPLPRCEQHAPPAPIGSAEDDLDDRQLQVLFAEDHAVNRRVIELILAQTNIRLHSVENGALALEAFEKGDFDVVLMDMQMPVMDGLMAVRKIRQYELRTGKPRCRILMLTANTLEIDVELSREAGADLHLGKPVNAARLLEAIFKN